MKLKVWLGATAIALAVSGCFGNKGMDRVFSLKSVDKVEQYTQEMSPEEAEIFNQTVMADIRSSSLQIGFAALSETFKTQGDPSRDADTTQMEAALGKLAALEGKTLRAATIENLEAHKARIQTEKNQVLAELQAQDDLKKQIDSLQFKVHKVDIRRSNAFSRTSDVLELNVTVSAPSTPTTFINSFTVSVNGTDGQAIHPGISITKGLTLPCSECELQLYSFEDSAQGYAGFPRTPASYTVKVKEWAIPNQVRRPPVDMADLDQRLATLDRKIALISKSKGN